MADVTVRQTNTMIYCFSEVSSVATGYSMYNTSKQATSAWRCMLPRRSLFTVLSYRHSTLSKWTTKFSEKSLSHSSGLMIVPSTTFFSSSDIIISVLVLCKIALAVYEALLHNSLSDSDYACSWTNLTTTPRPWWRCCMTRVWTKPESKRASIAFSLHFLLTPWNKKLI